MWTRPCGLFWPTNREWQFLSEALRASVGSVTLPFTLPHDWLCSRWRLFCQLGLLIKATANTEHEQETKLCYCEFLRSEAICYWDIIKLTNADCIPERAERTQVQTLVLPLNSDVNSDISKVPGTFYNLNLSFLRNGYNNHHLLEFRIGVRLLVK